jgi:hypothetical protein
MLKCQDIAKIVATEGAGDLSLLRKMELRLHMMMCIHCRNYLRQIKALGEGARRLAAGAEPSTRELEELEQEICNRIINHGNGG